MPFRNVRIGTRLFASFMVLLALSLLISFVSLVQLESLRTVTQNIVDLRVRLVTLSNEANHHGLQAANYLLQLLQTEEREERIPLYAMMDKELADLGRAVSDIGGQSCLRPPAGNWTSSMKRERNMTTCSASRLKALSCTA